MVGTFEGLFESCTFVYALIHTGFQMAHNNYMETYSQKIC